MASVLNPLGLRQTSLRQFLRYLGRFVRDSPSLTPSLPPTHTVRLPPTPGTGLFFFPADEPVKTRALAVGPLGETSSTVHPCRLWLSRTAAVPAESSIPTISLWCAGGSATVAKSLLGGVTQGFAVNLELHGVGYRAEADEKRGLLVLRLGLSHVIELPLLENGVFFNVISPQVVQVAGINRGDVHQRAASVRDLRPPEPYKGKGIRYRDEPVRRKESKKDS